MLGGAGQAPTCVRCGAAATGNFCSSCGASLSVAGGESFVETLPVVGEPLKFVRTFFKILKSPNQAPVTLAEDHSFRGHFAFLMVGLGILVAFALFMTSYMQQQSGQAELPQDQASYLDNYLYNLLIGYTIGAVMVYAIYRLAAKLLGGKVVAVETHAKLWALLTGFYLPLQVALLIILAAIGVVAGVLFPDLYPGIQELARTIAPWFFLGFNLLMLVNFAFTHTKLWQRPLPVSLLIIAACVVLSSYPTAWIQYAFGYVMGSLAGLAG
mgnify:CR=1 FL=1